MNDKGIKVNKAAGNMWAEGGIDCLRSLKECYVVTKV